MCNEFVLILICSNLCECLRRCHQYRFSTVIGSVMPDLIELPVRVTEDALSALLRLGFFLSEEYIKETAFANALDNMGKWELKFLDKFYKQLRGGDGGESVATSKVWKFPGVTVIFPWMVRPHYDRLNPTKKDYTFQVNTWVGVHDLGDKVKKVAREKLGEGVARVHVSFLFYQRQCLEREEVLRKSIRMYRDGRGEDRLARNVLCDLFENVDSMLNYKGRFFGKMGYSMSAGACVDDDEKLSKYYTGKCMATPECVDRLVSVCYCCM